MSIFCLVLFFSCEDKDQINGAVIEPQQDEYISTDLNPGGDNFGHVGNLYLNLANGQNYSERFWKFNYFHLSGGNHIGPNEEGTPDILTLNSYQDSYYVPSNYFQAPCFDFETETPSYPQAFCDCDSELSESECTGDDCEWNGKEQVCIDQGGVWLGDGDLAYVLNVNPSCYLNGQEIIGFCLCLDGSSIENEDECISASCDWSDSFTLESCESFGEDAIFYNSNSYIPLIQNTQTGLTTQVTQDSSIVEIESELSLRTPSLAGDSPLDEMSWSVGESMYSFSTMDQIRDTLVVEYSYDYKLKENFVPIDTVLTSILDDVMVVVDNLEINNQARTYDIYDTLQIQGQQPLPITVSREHTFYSYKNQINYSFGQRQTTDCNDNYQKDIAELREYDFSSKCGSCSDTSVDNLDDCLRDNGLFACSLIEVSELFVSEDECADSCVDFVCLQTNESFLAEEECNENCNDECINSGSGSCDMILNEWSSDWVDNNGCDSYCSDNESLSMYDLCWNFALDDNRLTAHCVESSSIGPFCDFGNSLPDDKEVLYDACPGDCDGENGDLDVIGQGVEPFEDRNCNGSYDLAEQSLNAFNETDCASEYGTWLNGECFLDLGNGQWDGEELCYGGADSCNYIELYSRGLSPNYLLVTYADQEDPTVIIDVYPGDVYLDCGDDLECNEDEDDFDPGTCSDGFSGTEELCYKHNGCWNYNLDQDNSVIGYDANLEGCEQENAEWTENLDPKEDDHPSGGERNFIFDQGEFLIRDFDGSGDYSHPTQITTRFLNYEECSIDSPSDNCGNQTFDIISDGFEVATASSVIQKEDSRVNLSSYSVIGQVPVVASSLNDLNIVKTKWPDSDELDGDAEDYMLFMDSNNKDASGMHYIIKMIQPYYYYANSPYTGIFETLPDQWWKSLQWEQDTLIYSTGGSIIDGQKRYSSYSVQSDTANYTIHKEYEVSMDNADMVYSNTVQDCILITRTITTTMLGPAIDFKIKSETYLKEGYPIVKEDVYWSWPPIFDGDRIFTKISSIEACGDECPPPSETGNGGGFSGGGLFDLIQPLNLDQLENNHDFDFDQFKLSNTMGLQRVEVPE